MAEREKSKERNYPGGLTYTEDEIVGMFFHPPVTKLPEGMQDWCDERALVPLFGFYSFIEKKNLDWQVTPLGLSLE